MRFVREELYELQAKGLYRQLRHVKGAQGSRVVLDGREVVLLCSNNYLGLAAHPALTEAAISALRRYGTGSGGSRLVSGTMELHTALEEQIASFKGTEAALLFNSGYAANTGIIPALVGRHDFIFSDRFNHASIIDGALLSHARLIRYPHRDTDALRKLLSATAAGGRRLIVTDGIFSMDGDLAPLKELVVLKNEFGAMLMVDDAHGTGVLGEKGRGSAELCGVSQGIDVQMGTLGKGLGGYGAYVACSRELVDYLINRARSFIFSTSLPPAVLAAAIAAFALVDSVEGAELRRKLTFLTNRFREGLHSTGFDTMDSTSQIVPVFVGGAEEVMEFSRLLLDKGVFVQGIRPPTVPSGSCRLRCTIMSTHSENDLAQALEAMRTVGATLGVI